MAPTRAVAAPMLLDGIPSPPLNMKGRLCLSVAEGVAGGVERNKGKILLKALHSSQIETFQRQRDILTRYGSRSWLVRKG